MDHDTYQAEAMQIAERLAKSRFRSDPDRETKVADTISMAWELSIDPPAQAKPKNIGYAAYLRVLSCRQFKQSTRSVDCPDGPDLRQSAAWRGEFRRVYVDLLAFATVGDDPAEIVALRLDAKAWLQTLGKQAKEIALALAAGHETGQTALMFGLRASQVSTLRRELKENWDAFQA